MGDVFVRDLADLVCRHVAFVLGPVRVELRHVIEQHLERGLSCDAVVLPDLAVGPFFHPGDRVDAVQRRVANILVPCLDGAVGQIADQRFARFGVAQVIAVRTDQIGRCRVFLQEGDVAGFPPVALDDHAVDQREQKRRVGFGLNWNPFGRQRAGDRQMRLHLYPFQAAYARIRLAPHARNPARRLDVVAAIDDVVAVRRVGRNDERPVPQLAVKMFGVIALHPLPAAEPHVDRPPG